jgi:rhodanese-related sulfurtransferase
MKRDWQCEKSAIPIGGCGFFACILEFFFVLLQRVLKIYELNNDWMMKKILTCLLATLGLTTACGQQNFENVDVEGFSELIGNPGVVLLDVRSASEYAEGHIAGAMLIDQGQSDFMEKAKAALPADKKIAVYCRSGRRSANAAGRLAAEGYQCVNLKGGIIAWKEAGKAVTTDTKEQAPLKKVYNEDINPLEQIDQALAKAKTEGKFVVCQVGGNWCIWCLRFADFIANDAAIGKVISDNFEYIHVNYNPKKSGGEEKEKQAAALMQRLENCGRFGFPVFVVLDGEGRVIHIQDSSFLEEGQGYNQEKVLRFFRSWTPEAVGR